MSDTLFDMIIVGAGPAGIAVGLAAHRHGLNALLLDRGCVCNTIERFPERMTFFSTPELLEFDGAPMVVSLQKPTRTEALDYFTRLARMHALKFSTYEEVKRVTKREERFEVETSKRSLNARSVVIAVGSFDIPNRLNVPGEDLPHVSHYYRSAQPYVGKRVVIVGGKNSAIEAALDLHRNGAKVTVVYRGTQLSDSIKYWIKPDFQNRIDEGSIHMHWKSTVERIEPNAVFIQSTAIDQQLPCDNVLLLTGHLPDYGLLERCGIELSGEFDEPKHNYETLETNIPALYVAGLICAGRATSKIFIENSRHHGEIIVRHFKQTHFQ